MGSQKKILFVMGSYSDFDKVSPAFHIFKSFDVTFDAKVISAHRTPDIAIREAKDTRNNGYSIIICAAGMAAHLAGVFAANTTLPVIGLPLSGGICDGLDALLSTVQMPSGFPVATVAVNGSKNAAYLAISILSIEDEILRAKLEDNRNAIKESIEEANQKLNGKI